MKRNLSRIGISTFLAVFLFAPPAYANMGVPMIFITLPAMMVALIPIIAIETYVLLERLGLSLWRSIEVASVANLGSTIIGTPVTWLLLLFVQVLADGGRGFGIDTARGRFLTVTLGAPWQLPHEDKRMNWIVPAAGFMLLIPFFFASWLVEFKVGMWILGEVNAEQVSDAIFAGNFVTYGILGAITGAITLYQLWITVAEDRADTVAEIRAQSSAEFPSRRSGKERSKRDEGELTIPEDQIARKALKGVAGQTRRMATADGRTISDGRLGVVKPGKSKRAAHGNRQ